MWLPDGWWKGTAAEVTAPGERLQMMRAALIGSGFAVYAAGIDPRRMSDADLARATPDYRVLRITRIEPRTGPGGPGDLAWVWPAAVQALAVVAVLRGWRRSSARRRAVTQTRRSAPESH